MYTTKDVFCAAKEIRKIVSRFNLLFIKFIEKNVVLNTKNNLINTISEKLTIINISSLNTVYPTAPPDALENSARSTKRSIYFLNKI